MGKIMGVDYREELIPKGHPNRPGSKLDMLMAIIVHYTANDRAGATDTMNVRYIGRAYDIGSYWSGSEKKTGPIEKGSAGKGEKGGGIPFRHGSAHVFCDMDSITLAIPTDEVAWGCGDRPMKYDPIYRGQQKIAKLYFGFRQNYRTVSVEICNNDAVKNSDDDWNGAVANAKTWIKAFIGNRKLAIDVNKSLHPQDPSVPFAPGKILILRHHDVSGKICPKPFVSDPVAWERFVRDVAGE